MYLLNQDLDQKEKSLSFQIKSFLISSSNKAQICFRKTCLFFLTSYKISVLAWRIPGTEEPGGLSSMESHRVGHDWSDLAAAAAEQGEKFVARKLLNDKVYLRFMTQNTNHLP